MYKRFSGAENTIFLSMTQNDKHTNGKSPLWWRIVSHLDRLVVLIGALLISVDAWLARTWESLSVDEVLYHLKAPLEGTDTTVVWEYLRFYGLIALAIVALISIMYAVTSRHGRFGKAFSFALTLALGIGMSVGAVYDFIERTGIHGYLSMVDEDFIGAHYVDPKSVDIEFPERKRNLIYLFLESMEMTYADEASGGAFPQNVIPELTQLAQQNEDFSGAETTLNGGLVLPGTGWTVGAMFGQSSGVPLKLPFKGNNMGDLDSFFPGLTTLGNILQDNGYHQTLLIGSDADFAARREYYLEHGNFDVYDYNRAAEEGYIPEGYKVFWGFEDARLFTWAQQILPQLAAGDQPFNLTMLTVDTHFEDGWVCDLCGNEFGDDQYANVMACSSRQVAAFVNWLSQQDFWENTTLIISGDHTTMDKDFCENVSEDYSRRTYMTIINGAATPEDPEMTRSYSTLDMFPTTLAAIGATVEGDRLGLGTNLSSTRPTIVEQSGLETCVEGLNRQSEFLNGYSDAKITDDLVSRALNRCYLNYWYDHRGMTGFALANFDLINEEMVEEAILEVTDDRTGSKTTYELERYKENPNHPNAYIFVERRYIHPDDLKYMRAKVTVKVTGHDPLVVAAWTGSRGNVLLSEYDELEEAARARWASQPGVRHLGGGRTNNVFLSY